jgi:hypothetical protein
MNCFSFLLNALRLESHAFMTVVAFRGHHPDVRQLAKKSKILLGQLLPLVSICASADKKLGHGAPMAQTIRPQSTALSEWRSTDALKTNRLFKVKP